MSRLLCILLVSAAVLAGCAEPVQTGFLAPYHGFERRSPIDTDMQYVNPHAHWQRYTKVRICPVTICYAPGWHEVNPADAAKLASSFEQELGKAFGEDYELVSSAGPDVLDIRAAVSNLRPTNVVGNAAAQTGSFFLPLAWSLGLQGYKSLTGDQLGMGEAQVEAEFCDSLTQQRLYGYVARKIGSSFDVVGQTTAWGVVETALGKWSRLLHRELQCQQNPARRKILGEVM